MKLSFSLSTKPSGKPPVAVNQSSKDPNQSSSQTKEFLTEFDASKKTLDRSKLIAPIPPLPNSDEWTDRKTKRMKNLDLPVESDDPNNLQFEVDTTLSVDSTDSTITYGLNLRNQDGNKSEEDGGDAAAVMKLKPKSNIESSMLQKFKEDLKNLPDDRGMEEFDGMSVENFAPALLAGYGWVEGKGIEPHVSSPPGDQSGQNLTCRIGEKEHRSLSTISSSVQERSITELLRTHSLEEIIGMNCDPELPPRFSTWIVAYLKT